MYYLYILFFNIFYIFIVWSYRHCTWANMPRVTAKILANWNGNPQGMSSPHYMLHRNFESHSLNFLGYPWVKDDKASSNETSQHSLGCKQKLLVLQNQEDLQRLQIFNCNLGKAIGFVLLCPAHKNRPAEPGWVGCTFWQIPPSWPRPPTIRMHCLRVVLFWPLSSSIPATESILASQDEKIIDSPWKCL